MQPEAQDVPGVAARAEGGDGSPVVFDVKQLRLDGVKALRPRQRREPFDVTRIDLSGVATVAEQEARLLAERGSREFRASMRALRRATR